MGYIIHHTMTPPAGLDPRQARAYDLVLRGHWVVTGAGQTRHSGHFWTQELEYWVRAARADAPHHGERARANTILDAGLVERMLVDAGYALGAPLADRGHLVVSRDDTEFALTGRMTPLDVRGWMAYAGRRAATGSQPPCRVP